MSATTISPHNARPGIKTCAGFLRTNVTVSAARTQTAPIGHWSGPFRSGYGWHLLRVSEREAARPLRLHEIRARVHEDYLQYGRQAANEQAYAELAGRYRVQQQP